ncbi:MAG: hypothetical protein Q4B79_08120 [Moraxella sp.]|uniref:hypothetical protein n=1 Tax=Moraxella sp. TaxID=479 RepID=UPI0026DB1DBD|nr:hypothetical protein [Moraxella sp.]MDO4450905.1 hypothetical protein [Moraxella sp.]
MNYIAYFNQICLQKNIIMIENLCWQMMNLLKISSVFLIKKTMKKITRNAILILGHIGFVYQFFPNSAFEFILQYKDKKKLIFYVAKSIHLFPQFIHHQEYSEILLKLANGAPKKECMLLLYVIISRLLDKIDDNEFLLKIVDIFKGFIERYTKLYQSQNEYPNLIKKKLVN